MKKVISGNELREKIEHAVDLLCNCVKTTLGPNGCNVIIDHSDFSPYVTNDGVTIAKNIESDDEIVNTILELAKESTIKTDDETGDGTTTTLVLLQAIFKQGLNLINNGVSPIVLQRKINEISNDIVSRIEVMSKKPNSSELLKIACISANDIEIGKVVYEVFSKIKDKSFINLVEGEKVSITYTRGYIFDSLLASAYFMENNSLEYTSPYILISDSSLYDVDNITDILNYINDKPLIILSPDYDDGFVNNILSLVINDGYKIVLLKAPEYGSRQLNILKDVACISNAKISHNVFDIDCLGSLNSSKIDKDNVLLDFLNNDLVKNRVRQLKNELKNETDDYEIDFYKKRIAMLKNRTAEISVGGGTNTIIRERKMRFQDSLCAVSAALDGVVVGGGVTLYKISNELQKDKYNDIFKNALKEPLICILKNSGVDNQVLSEIEARNYNVVYNINNEKFEDINNTYVLDPRDVVINSIKNASLVAGMLLTTSSLVVNEYKNNKVDVDYGNI